MLVQSRKRTPGGLLHRCLLIRDKRYLEGEFFSQEACFWKVVGSILIQQCVMFSFNGVRGQSTTKAYVCPLNTLYALSAGRAVCVSLACVFRIHIVDAEGDDPAPVEVELYDPIVASVFDEECGTFGSEAYAPAEGRWLGGGSDGDHLLLPLLLLLAVVFADG